MNQRLGPNVRRAMILKATARAIRNHGILTFTDEQVIEGCELTTSLGTLRRYFARRSDLITALCETDACPSWIKDEAKQKGLLNV